MCFWVLPLKPFVGSGANDHCYRHPSCDRSVAGMAVLWQMLLLHMLRVQRPSTTRSEILLCGRPAT
jgi:hypothetical protein